MIAKWLRRQPLSDAAELARQETHAQLDAIGRRLQSMDLVLERTQKHLADHRRILEEQRQYLPQIPRHGYTFRPPALYRHMESIRLAMLAEDEKRVLQLQTLLAHSGYEVPTNLDEVAECLARIDQQVNST